MKTNFVIKEIKGSKVGLITMEKEPFDNKKMIYLVNNDFEIESLTSEKLHFKVSRHGMSVMI